MQIACNAWVCEAHGSLQASRCLQPAARLPGSSIPTPAHLQHHLTDLCWSQRQEPAGTGSDSRLTASLQAPKIPFPNPSFTLRSPNMLYRIPCSSTGAGGCPIGLAADCGLRLLPGSRAVRQRQSRSHRQPRSQRERRLRCGAAPDAARVGVAAGGRPAVRVARLRPGAIVRLPDRIFIKACLIRWCARRRPCRRASRTPTR